MTKFLRKGQLPILLTNAVALIFFSSLFFTQRNYEFVIYVAVIVLFLAIILATGKKVEYGNGVLWGLTLWSVMHMAGGGLFFSGTKLYEIILLPLVGEPFNIFKYDQLVHAIGFGVATLLVFQLLKPLLRKDNRKWTALSIVVVMAGLGVGALNEILEFAVTVVAPSTGVGGYENTALDLVFNLFGAIVAMFFIRKKENG